MYMLLFLDYRLIVLEFRKKGRLIHFRLPRDVDLTPDMFSGISKYARKSLNRDAKLRKRRKRYAGRKDRTSLCRRVEYVSALV